MTIKSVFGTYADGLQGVIDDSLDLFKPLYYPRYFPLAPKQLSLSFKQVIGASRIEAAASVTARGSKKPLRGRPNLALYEQSIPQISEKFQMLEDDYRSYKILQATNIDPESAKNQTLDYIFNDVQKAGTAAHKRVDIMVLQALSTGTVTLDIDVNPDGVVLSKPIDLLVGDTSNKGNASISWATSATAKPIDDINKVVSDASAKGITFEKILMSRELFVQFKATKQVQDNLAAAGFLNMIGNKQATAVVNAANINQYLLDEGLPYIEVVNESIGIEKDGIIGTVKPFDATMATFVPSGQLGTIKNAYAIEEFAENKLPDVSYGVYNNALISKYGQNDPWAEYTAVEFNAFPSFDAIGQSYFLKAIV